LAIWDKLFQKGDSKDKEAKMLWERAQKYFEGKLFNRALKDLSDAITLQPKYLQEAMDLMQAFMMQGNDEQALSVGLAMLKMDPQNFELMNKLGNALRKLGSFSKAKRLYTMALKINPRYTEAKYNLAACSFGIATADGELIRQTKQVEAYNQPRRYEFMGERAGFFPVPNQALETDKDNHPEDSDDGEEKSEEDHAQMSELMAGELKNDVAATQGAWEAIFNLGLFYDLTNMGELALQNMQKTHEMVPDAPEPANNLAVIIWKHKKDLEKAESLFLKNLTTNKFDRTTVLNLAVLYKEQGKAFQTLKFYVYLGDLLNKSMGDFDTEQVQGHARDLFERRKYMEAIPFYANLAKELGEDYWYEKLATMYYNQKKEELYIKTLRELLNVNPHHADASQKIGVAAQQYEEEAREKMDKGSRRQAIQLFEKAVKIEETPERWVELAQLYEAEGEEILAGNALKKWKVLSGQQEATEEHESEAGEALT